MRNLPYIKRVVIGAAAFFTIIVMTAGAQTEPFYECGIIWPDSGCYLLDVNGNHNNYYIIDSIGEFNSGEWACVYGVLDESCDTSCTPIPVEWCVSVDSLLPGTPPDTTYYFAHGVILQGTGCLVFSPYSGPLIGDGFYLLLENYGSFGLGDSVVVLGTLLLEPAYDCPEASGQLLDNTIEAWSPPNTPFSDCGILTMQYGCLLFEPLSLPGNYFYLSYYGTYGANDSVCVSGILIQPCDTGCPGADGCIVGNSIYGWYNEGWPYERCGVITQGIDCIVFAPFNDSVVLALDYTGGYTTDDTVCISGIVEWGCDMGCTGVAGCLYTSEITFRPDFYHNFEVIVKLEESFSIEPILADYGGSVTDSLVLDNTYLVSFPVTYLIEDIITEIESRPGVVFVQPNYMIGFPETFHVSQSFPDDNPYELVWGVSPNTYFSAAGMYTINSDSANLFSGGEDIVVAVIDNGIDLTHPLFETSVLGTGYDFIDDDNDPSEEAGGGLLGHGTFVSGVIRRIAPDCMILPIRAFDSFGYSNSYILADAIHYAIEQSADVINMSFGNYTSNPIIHEAINDAIQAGICLVASAGNANTNIPSYPASYSGVIAVSAIDTLEYRADFSNYGDYIDICAPGVSVYSSLAGDYEWGSWSGTSFAAPMVTAVCALILSENSDLIPYDIEDLICLTADTNLLWGSFIPPSSEYGYGRVDALTPVIDVSLGDVDNSRDKNLYDIIYMINALYKGGPQPVPTEDVGDTDCSDHINLLDITKLIIFLYKNGQEPSCFMEY